MRFLANENFPLDAVEALRQDGHDVTWIRTEFPGISDPEVLSLAQAEERILLTFDKDFGELAFRSKLPVTVGIILFRIKAPSGAVVAQKVARAIAMRDDWYGHFSVVEDDKIRMRMLKGDVLANPS
jgi:predicted nuclease of predicted toxin-antitoxin system